jgi:hypothetical protein
MKKKRKRFIELAHSQAHTSETLTVASIIPDVGLRKYTAQGFHRIFAATSSLGPKTSPTAAVVRKNSPARFIIAVQSALRLAPSSLTIILGLPLLLYSARQYRMATTGPQCPNTIPTRAGPADESRRGRERKFEDKFTDCPPSTARVRPIHFGTFQT